VSDAVVSLADDGKAALPPDLFDDSIVLPLLTSMRQLFPALQGDYLPQTIVFKASVASVPPKPEIHNLAPDSRVAKRLKLHGDRLTTFHPLGVTDVNIGSNDGVLQLLLKYRAEYALMPTGSRFYVADINIFTRCLKVLFICAYFN
jgi:hypothetical protein